MKRNWQRWLIDILIVVAVFSAVRWWGQRDLASGPAPALTGVMADGTTYAPQPVDGARLVHFWASWCPVCGITQRGVDRLSQTWPVITVALNSGDPDAVSRHLGQHHLSHPTIVDESGELASQWGVRGVPASFIVDSQGQIRYRSSGLTPAWVLRLWLWWYR